MKTAEPTDWKTKALPSKRTTVPLNRLFLASQMEEIRRGLIPEEMEDKWFIYWKDDTLFFHRSWTGFCVYLARFVPDGENCRMIEADVNRDPSQYTETNDDKDAESISFLIDLLLLRQRPVPPSDGSGGAKQAFRTWSQVGRAMFDQHPDDE